MSPTDTPGVPQTNDDADTTQPAERWDAGDAAVLVVKGDLDVSTYRRWQVKGRALMQRSGHRLVIDLEQVRFVDSSGLRVMVFLRNEAQENGGSLTVQNAPANVQSLLRLSGLDTTFTA